MLIHIGKSALVTGATSADRQVSAGRRPHMALRGLIYFALVLATVVLSISQHGLNGVGGCHAHNGLAWHCHE
jgi:hypothetical protein